MTTSTTVLVHTSESPEFRADSDRGHDRYYYGACNRGLPLNSDRVSCSGDCHPSVD